MSWLGSGISQITGQISNFTKEVLTEGTEEVDDHATELKVSQSKIKELQQLCASHKAENDRLKKLNDDLTERLEASELQLSTIHSTYREQLNFREDEVKALKQQQNEWLDSHRSSNTLDPGSHTVSSPNLLAGQGLAGDEHDFDDVISSQHEINRLRNQVQRLNAQCEHWKQVSATSTASNVQGRSDYVDGTERAASDEEIVQLRAQIQELQRKSRKEVDDHQHQLSALQNAHSTKLAQVKRAHKQEVQQLQRDLETQHQQKTDTSEKDTRLAKDAISFPALEGRVVELEQEKERLLKDLDVAKSEALDLMRRKVPSSTPRAPGKGPSAAALEFSMDSSSEGDITNELHRLREQVSNYEQEMQQFELIKTDYEMEKDALQDVVVKLRTQLRDKEEEISMLQQASMRSDWSNAEDDTADMLRQLEEFKQVNAQLKAEHRKVLQEQMEERDRSHSLVEELRGRVESEIGDGMQKVTEMEEQLHAKNAELLALSEQLQTKENNQKRLSAAVDELNNSMTEKESENALLLEKLQQIEEQIKGEQDAERAAAEVTSLQGELVQQRAAADQKSLQLNNTQHELQKLQQRLDERETAVKALERDKKALETSLEELDAQHSQVIQEVVRKRDELMKANEELQESVKSLQNKLNESLSEKEKNESEDAQGSEMVEKLKEDMRRAEVEAQQLKAEKEQKTKDLEEMKQKLSQGAVALNELHMDRKELEDRTMKLQRELKEAWDKVGDLAKEKRGMEDVQKRMEEELNSTKQEVTALKSEESRQQLHHELLQLKDNLNDSQRLSTAHEEKVGQFEEELRKLQEKLAASDEERLQLNSVLENSALSEEQMKEEFEEKIKLLREEIDSLGSQKMALEKELDSAETRQREQVRQYENCIRELREARDKDASSLQTEHEDMIKQNHDKDLRMSELENECTQLQAQVKDTKELLQDTLNGQSHLKEMLSNKRIEIQTLRGENEALKTTLDETNAKSIGFQADLKNLSDFEKMYKQCEERNEKLVQEITRLKLEIEENNSEKEKVNENETEIIDLESQIASLQSIIEEKNSSIETYQKQIESLESQTTEGHTDHATMKQYEDTIQEHQSSISFLKFDLSAKNTELLQANEKLKRLTSEVKEYKEKIQELTNAKEISDGTSDDGSGSGSHATDLQVEELRSLIGQKDDIVNELRSNNDALLRLLEERSMQLHGDKTLVEMHKLENELRGLRMEKEQIMNVLNEKSRECSSLKGEVHRLMNVVSQEKAALTKLQQDNQDLVTTKQSDIKATETEEVNKEMTKEAVKKLSQIIRDKDLEIESLTQKNGTLLQVLQETSGSSIDAAGAQLGALMQDKDNLMKQIALFQKDREQIIGALNQKHQEVALYYTELQKLTAIHKEVMEKQDELSQQFTMLQHQYEDKQQQLLKSQKELVSFKQKYTEADNRYNELLQRRSESPEIVNGSRGVEIEHPLVKNGRVSPFQVIKEDVVEEVQVQKVPQSNSSPKQDNSLAAAISPALLEEKNKMIETLKSQGQKLRENVTHKDGMLEDLKKRVENRDGLIQHKDEVIGEKDKTISELNARVHRSEEKISQKDLEIHTIRKQQENLAFQLQGLQTELQDAVSERDQLAGQIPGMHSEVAMLKEAKSKFSMELSQKELELNGMREKVKSLQAFVQEEKGSMEKGTVDQMLAETEAMQKQAHMFQQERDQAYMALQQKQSEGFSMQNQIAKLQEKEGKLTREVERLRSHLLQIEEGYTQEAIAAEEREKDLRNRLAASEEKALSSSHAVYAASQEATEQVDALQQQLHSLASQRDAAMLELSAAQEQATQYSTSLNNLQMVLEQFQHEREVQQAAEIEKYQRDLEASKIQCLQLQSQLNAVQSELDETQGALQAAQRLSEQLDKKTEAIAALKEEVQIRENSLKQMEMEMSKLANISEAKVDKALVKNLFIGYFHTPSAKRKEVLHVISSVLGLTVEEISEISHSGGWLTGLFRRGGGSGGSLMGPTPPTTPSKSGPDKSFSELFVSFLERESSPRPQVRLPTDQMVKEQHKKHSAQRTARATFNPFAVPAASTTPGMGDSLLSGGGGGLGGTGSVAGAGVLPSTVVSRPNILTDPGGGGGSSHLLMRPSFSPVTVTVAAQDTLPTAGGSAGSGRASANSSGRSTPAGSGILRDVLQK